MPSNLRVAVGTCGAPAKQTFKAALRASIFKAQKFPTRNRPLTVDIFRKDMQFMRGRVCVLPNFVLFVAEYLGAGNAANLENTVRPNNLKHGARFVERVAKKKRRSDGSLVGVRIRIGHFNNEKNIFFQR
jgi:hypothetical protein